MRAIDRFAGVPLCWILGALHFVLPLRRKERPRYPKKVLLIKFFGMGSILLSTPALSVIKTTFPDACLTYLSFLSNKELLDRIPLVDRVLTIDPSTITSFIRDSFRVIGHFRSAGYDAVFDFEFFSKFSTLLSALSGAPCRAAFAIPTFWRSSLTTHQVPLQKDRHVRESFCALVSVLTGTHTVPEVSPPAVYDEDIRSLHLKIPINGRPLVAVNVNAGQTFLERRWMPERFAEVVSRLSLRLDCDFAFIGDRREREYVHNVIAKSSCPQRCHNLAGTLTIPELSALFLRCELLISNDSGPLHLGSAMGIPCIGLFGPESPDFYGPTSGNAVAIYKQISCSPCMNIYNAKSFTCPYNARCMSMIEVADLQHAIEEMVVVS